MFLITYRGMQYYVLQEIPIQHSSFPTKGNIDFNAGLRRIFFLFYRRDDWELSRASRAMFVRTIAAQSSFIYY